MNEQEQTELLIRVDEGIQFLVEADKDKEQRLRKVETNQNKIMGATSLISVIFTAAVAWLFSKF